MQWDQDEVAFVAARTKGAGVLDRSFGMVADLCNYVIVPPTGKIAEQGPVSELFETPTGQELASGESLPPTEAVILIATKAARRAQHVAHHGAEAHE